MDSERWLPVVGYEGLYEVSDQGRVKSLARTIVRSNGKPHTVSGRIVKLIINSGGYPSAGLSRPGMKKKTLKVHRLVLEAFVGACPPGLIACHWNDEKEDNRLENLRWDSISANQYDRVRNGTHHQAAKTHCPQGHTYDEGNTYYGRSGGRRSCRQCQRDRQREYAARRAA